MLNALLLLIVWMFISSGDAQAAPERPVIFIPGILGSKLYRSDNDTYDHHDELVWGDRSSYRKFKHLRLHDNDKIIAHGTIETIAVLGPFRVKQYSDLLSHLEQLGYTRGKDLFVFAYDWRKSNFHTAERLNAYIDACRQTGSDCPRLADGNFDIVAHSMGGLVTRIFMDRHPANASRLQKVVTLGSPFRGSHAATDSVINGFSGLARLISGDQDQVRSVMLSFESGMELAPTYDSCCYTGDSWTNPTVLDLGLPESWIQFLPSGQSPDQWRAHIAKGLTRRQELINIVAAPPTGITRIFPVASSNITTRAQLLYHTDSGEVEWKYAAGDGTVTLGSASNLKKDEARVSMKKHSHIFDDKYVEESLRRILVADRVEFPFAVEYTACQSNPAMQCYYVGELLARTANVEVVPGITLVNNAAEVAFTILPDLAAPEDLNISPHLCISSAEDPENTCLVTRRMDRVQPTSPDTIAFQAPAYLSKAGDYRASVHTGQDEIVAEYFSVLELEE